MDEQDGFVTVEDPTAILYADVNSTLAAEAVAALKPEPSRVFSDDTTYEPWNSGVDVGFFFTLEDRAIPIATQRSMASRFPSGSITYTMNSSHSPFLSMPEILAAGIVLASTDALLKKVV